MSKMESDRLERCLCSSVQLYGLQFESLITLEENTVSTPDRHVNQRAINHRSESWNLDLNNCF